MAALQAMMRTDRNDVEPRLGAIRAPALIVMGTRDPDFDDPAGEAATMAGLVKRQGRHDRRRRPLSPCRNARGDRAGDPRLPRRSGGPLMPRAGLTPDSVLDAAARIADADGLPAVTLARLAAELGVRPPSLYKHVDGLDAIHRGLALRGLQRGHRPLPARHHRQGARGRALRLRPRLLAIRPRAPGALCRIGARRQAGRE